MEAEQLINNFIKWFKSEIRVSPKLNSEGWQEVILPILDNENDYLEFYIKIDGEKVFLNDGGLSLMRIDLNKEELLKNRIEILKNLTYFNGNLKIENNAVIVETNIKDFPICLQLFVHAILQFQFSEA